LKARGGPALVWICTWTAEETWGAARGLLPQASVCCPSRCCWGLEGWFSAGLCLTAWVWWGASPPPPHCTEGRIGDTEEVELKAGSGEEGDDRGVVPSLVAGPCTPLS